MTESSSSFDIKKKEIEHIIRKICSDKNATSLTFSESRYEFLTPTIMPHLDNIINTYIYHTAKKRYDQNSLHLENYL